jgi:hypothetical protein
MQLLVDNLWPEILRRCRLARNRKAAIAYVTDLSSVDFQEGDLLIVDASEAVIKSGGTSAAVLAELSDRGVQLYSYPFLHAKVWIFDSTVVVGSANASARSQTGLLEAGLLTTDGAVVAASKATIETLKRGGERLTKLKIGKLLRLPVDRAPMPPGKAKCLGMALGGRVWITSGPKVEESLASTKQENTGRKKAREVAKSRVSIVERMEFERGAMLYGRLQLGDRVIWIWTEGKLERPVEVDFPTPVIFDQKVRRGGLCWYEQTRADRRKTLSWRQFKKLAAHCGLKDPLRERMLTLAQVKKVEASWDDFVE